MLSQAQSGGSRRFTFARRLALLAALALAACGCGEKPPPATSAPQAKPTAAPVTMPPAAATPVATPTPSTPTPAVAPSPVAPAATVAARAPDGPIGFAAIEALGQRGTTGGAGGAEVTVTTAEEFLAAIARPEPLTIRVSGMLRLPGPMHDVASDKTILGLGAASGISGGGLNLGLPTDDAVTAPPANAVQNVIVRNLVLTDCPDDCLNVQMFSHHVWIDHCDFSRQGDGALDIKRGADCITVSWNRFHDSDKNMLLGHDDKCTQDRGRLRVTYHHNWFDGSKQRNPRVRFGEPVHVFNNYFLNNTGYGVAAQMDAGVVVEGNYFEKVNRPVRTDVTSGAGRIVERRNVFVDSKPSKTPVATGRVVEPRTFYAYELDDPERVPELVRRGAGTGKLE